MRRQPIKRKRAQKQPASGGTEAQYKINRDYFGWEIMQSHSGWVQEYKYGGGNLGGNLGKVRLHKINKNKIKSGNPQMVLCGPFNCMALSVTSCIRQPPPPTRKA